MKSAYSWTSNVVLTGLTLTMLITGPWAASQKFYPDDPLQVEADDLDASQVRSARVAHSSVPWSPIRAAGDRSSRLAINVNSMGEVPDSSWFTNRIGHRIMSDVEIARGPDSLSGPLSGPWIVVAGKTDGVTPGLRLRDSAGRLFFVKFDPPSNPEMASGAEIVATKLLFAAGYWVPENYIATLRREDLIIDRGATFKGVDGAQRPLTAEGVDRVLSRAARNADGTYRVLASLRVEGEPLGPFQYFGTRPDDPNDIVPHEHRRELRALRVFAAWLNHVDTKAQNSLDALVPRGERKAVRHYLIDLGSSLGSAGTGAKDLRDGYEYGFEGRTTMLALLTLGMYTPPWLHIEYPNFPAVGRIEGRHFHPEEWKPTLPNPAFRNTRADDTFWAAERVVSFSDDAIRAVVETARFSDPAAARYLSEVLISRRDQIGRSWLTDVNPIASPTIDREGRFAFRNAASDAGVSTDPAEYRVRWSLFDNTTRISTTLGPWTTLRGTTSSLPEVPAHSSFVMAEILAVHPQHPVWARPVRAYFRRSGTGAWTLVGFVRLDGANQES